MDEFIDMTRGLPSPAQLALSQPMMQLPGTTDFRCSDGSDWRSYGNLQGLAEVRALFGPVLMGLPATQIAVGGNSSLALMHEAIGHAWLHGLPASVPWRLAPRVRFLCPEPGYDRHFAICRYFGIDMVPVRMLGDGPDMEQVCSLAGRDPAIRGMWCMPCHSNPAGIIYSAQVIQQLAAMQTAAADFTLFCDNACTVHGTDGAPEPAATLHAACTRAGRPERTLVFASTSRLTIPGAGLAFIGGGPVMIDWWLTHQRTRTIGTDKVNQVRHLLFFADQAGLREHAWRHAQMLRARLDCVRQVFAERLAGVPEVEWSSPRAGYFLCLRVLPGRAHRVAERAEQAGVRLTPPGATHCTGIDPQNRYLRIAPSALAMDVAERAARVIAQAVLATHNGN